MNNRWIKIFIWLFAIMLAGLYLSVKLRVVSDITQFIPDYGAIDQRYTLFLDELNQGQTSKLLFLRLSTDSSITNAKLSQSLKQEMLKSGLFDAVHNGDVDYNFTDFESLFKYRYLLNNRLSKNTFSSSSLELALTERLKEIRAGMGMLLKQTIFSDPTNAFLDYLRNAKQWQEPEIQQGVWFTKDKKSALLIARIRQSGFDLERQYNAINFIRKSVVDLAKDYPVVIDITGPAAFAVETRDKIKHTLTVLSILAAGLILAILIIAYRSFALVLLVAIPLFSAIVVSMAITNAVFGTIHGITLAFGITLLGVCLDYPVHLFSHLRKNRSASDTLKSIWPTLRLGVLTTSLGYFVLLWSGFTGLSQLALFAIVGLVVALGVTRWLIVNWIPIQYQPRHQGEALIRVLDDRWRMRLGVAIVIIITGIVIISFQSIKGTVWEQDISSLSPIPEKSRKLDRELRQQLGVPDVNHIFILTNDNPEILLQQTEELALSLQSLVKMEVVEHIYSTTDFLPSQAVQRQRQALLPVGKELEDNLLKAMQHLPFKTDVFSPFIQAVETSRNLRPLIWDDMQNSPLADMINSDFFKRRDQWVSIIRLGGVSEAALLDAWLEQHPDASKAYFNLHQSASTLLYHYQKNAVIWLLAGLTVMVLILQYFIKSYASTVRILIAPVLAVIISLGLQVLLGIKLNLFHLLSVLLIIGIGIDYSLFFNRFARDRYDWLQSLHGVLVGASTTLVAFGILVFSEIPVLVAIGQTIAIGVVACLVLTLLLAKDQKHLST